MRLILLPGMGADGALYHGPWRDLPSARFIDWLPYRGETTLAQVAARLIQQYDITAEDIPGGSSLGGMVALEMAAALGCGTVCLIGSARTREEVNPLLRAAEPLAELTPWKFAKLVARLSKGHLPDVSAQVEPEFLRAMCHAIAQWPSLPTEHLRVVRIHGTHDWVIRCPDDAHKVAGAGHAIAWSHPQECVELVRKYVLSRAQGPA